MFEMADIILLETGSWIGRTILWVLRFFQSDPIRFNHCVLAANNKFGIEAATSGLKYCVLNEKLKRAKDYKVVRHRNLTDLQRENIVKTARSLVGLPYGFKRLILQFFDQLFCTNFFTKLIKDKQCQVCSSIIAWAYYVRCRIKFNDVGWSSADPDDFDDEFARNPGTWRIIREKING